MAQAASRGGGGPSGLGTPPIRALVVVALLYVFLIGVSTLEAGIKSFGADFQADLLAGVDHPIAGLSAGILATVLVQSSSVSTSTIVGLVGARTLTVDAAVPMIMGANIGTSVTNTLVALGSGVESLSPAEEAAQPLDVAVGLAATVWILGFPARLPANKQMPDASHRRLLLVVAAGQPARHPVGTSLAPVALGMVADPPSC